MPPPLRGGRPRLGLSINYLSQSGAKRRVEAFPMYEITTGGVDRETQQGLEKLLKGRVVRPEHAENIDQLCKICYNVAAARGWWTKANGTPKKRNFGELMALIHSEISEALEGGRRDLASDHIAGFSMLEEELADALIRIFDLAGGANLRLGEAFLAKIAFNAVRPDHKPEARAKAGGKSF